MGGWELLGARIGRRKENLTVNAHGVLVIVVLPIVYDVERNVPKVKPGKVAASNDLRVFAVNRASNL